MISIISAASDEVDDFQPVAWQELCPVVQGARHDGLIALDRYFAQVQAE
jgi:hypothetical protein